MRIPVGFRTMLLGAAAATLVAMPARAQWPSEDMELVYRNGHRALMKASPFIGIWKAEVDGGPWRIARSELAMICFAHLAPKSRTMEAAGCPKELPGDVKEDTVLWNDGTTTTGAVIVGGYQEGESVRQAGHRNRARQEAVYVQFAPAVATPPPELGRNASDALDHVGRAAARLPASRPPGD